MPTPEAVPGGEDRAIHLETIRDLLAVVMAVPRWWVAGLTVIAFLSTLEVTLTGGAITVSFRLTPITLAAVAVIWLPPLLRVIALSGGGVKTPAGEASATGLKEILTSLEPGARLQALTSVIASIPDSGREPKPALQSARRELERQVADLQIDPGVGQSRLLALTQEYDALRAAMPSGPERTYRMNQIVAEAAGLGGATGLRPESIPQIGSRDGDGARVISLALVQASPRPTDVDAVLDSLRAPRSPFEQYQALRAVERLVPVIGQADRSRLAAALRERMSAKDGIVIDGRDASRLLKAQGILRNLEA